MTWYLVRHGEIRSNVDRIYAGRSNEPLTARGRTEAMAVGRQMLAKGLAAVYTSPVRRAVETAVIIGNMVGIAPRLAPAFQEMALGRWEGLSEKVIERDFPKEWALWNRKPAALRMRGRETLRELQKRVLGGVHRIQKGINEKGDILVVTHVAIIRVLLLYSEGRDLNEYKKVGVGNGELFGIAGELLS